jgi:excisionase family DNA binding protein
VKTLSPRLLRVTRNEHPIRHADAHTSNATFAGDRSEFPVLLTVDEAADLLRTSRRAIYAMVERRQLPGVTRIRRRVLFRTSELLDWLDQKRASSLQE